MQEKKSFEVSYSTDGGTIWERDPEADSEVYMHAYKLCQDRSVRLKRLQKITNIELAKDLVIFTDGMPRACQEWKDPRG